MKDEYGYDMGDGFGTSEPTKEWTIYGYFETAREINDALSMLSGGLSTPQYKKHPNRPACLLWKLR